MTIQRAALDWRHALGLIGLLSLLLPTDVYRDRPATRPSTAEIVASATSSYAFDLVGWEIRNVVRGVIERGRDDLALAGVSEAERRELVTQYFRAVDQARQLRRQLRAMGGLASASEFEQRLEALESRQATLQRVTNTVLAQQLDTQLADQGISTAFVRLAGSFAFPPLSVEVGAPVFFSFSKMPLLLVVAPRGRIAVAESSFLRGGLSDAEMERIEDSVDAGNDLSSVVIPIGGFAAYPSMIPSDGSLRSSLETISHEWVHHYLATKPLGWHYFDNYALRSINETAADLVGREVAGAVLNRYYGLDEASTSGRSTRDTDFAQAMVETRRAVEAILDRGDVTGAEGYMAERKAWLGGRGYALRKLNTAYLTFYGAYSGAGNSVEPKLRLLRSQSTSLAAFMGAIAAITSERDLDGLLGK